MTWRMERSVNKERRLHDLSTEILLLYQYLLLIQFVWCVCVQMIIWGETQKIVDAQKIVDDGLRNF